MSDEVVLIQERTYIGRRINKEKLIYAFIKEDQEDTTDFSFSPKLSFPRGAAVGSIWSFKLTEDGSYWTRGENAPLFLRFEDDKELVISWELSDKNAYILDSNRKLGSKKQDMLDEALAPIHEALNKERSYAGRAYIIGYIIDRLYRF